MRKTSYYIRGNLLTTGWLTMTSIVKRWMIRKLS